MEEDAFSHLREELIRNLPERRSQDVVLCRDITRGKFFSKAPDRSVTRTAPTLRPRSGRPRGLTEMNHQPTDLDRLILEPMETLEVEYKGWLDLTTKSHKAKLAKEFIALANHGGGHVVLGFSDPSLTPLAKPDGYPDVTVDDVNGIVAAYADPAFHCQVAEVRGHLVISVPAGATVPIRSKRGAASDEIVSDCYYTRRPGPNSEQPRSGLEWDVLLRRCIANRDQELEVMVRRILRVTQSPGERLPIPPVDPIDELLK